MITDKKEPPVTLLGLLKRIRDLFLFFKKMGIVPIFFFLSVVCIFLSAFFNLFGLRLLIPLIQGLLEGDFSQVGDRLGIVRYLSSRFPESFTHSGAYFSCLLTLVLTAALVKNALDYVAGLSMGREIRKVDSNLRQLIVSRTLRFGKSYFDRVSVGTMGIMVLNAVSGVTGQLTALQRLLSQMLSLAVYVGVMIWVSWKLTFAFVLMLPIYHYSTNWLVEWIRRLSLAHEAARYNLMDRILDVLSNIPLVKTYGSEEEEKKKLGALGETELQNAYEVEKKELLIRPIQDLNGVLALILIVLAISLVTSGERFQHASLYFVFFFCARRAIPCFGSLMNFKMSLARAEGQITSFMALLSDGDKGILPDGTKTFPGFKNRIEFKNLHFAYGKNHWVLKNLNLVVEKGKVTAIVGPTGAGKTTLINLLVRFYDCPPGSITIDEEDIRNYKVQSLMDYIALVSQEPLLLKGTLRENIAYALENRIRDEDLHEVIGKAQLSGLIERLPEGLDTIIGDRGAQLSGGEKQRVMIARALLKKAELLILDEATSALDTKTERLIQKAIREATEDRTSIVIAHRLSTIIDADKIVVLEDGHIVEQGTLEELLNIKGKFYEYWTVQGIPVPEEDSKSAEPILAGSFKEHTRRIRRDMKKLRESPESIFYGS